MGWTTHANVCGICAAIGALMHLAMVSCAVPVLCGSFPCPYLEMSFGSGRWLGLYSEPVFGNTCCSANEPCYCGGNMHDDYDDGGKGVSVYVSVYVFSRVCAVAQGVHGRLARTQLCAPCARVWELGAAASCCGSLCCKDP